MVDEEISLGDFVLSGGELAAMALIDAVVRQLPGVLGGARSAAQDSFAGLGDGGLLDCPHYTRPEVWRDAAVPDVLLSGHHARIVRWRREQALAATWNKRPDLIERARRNGGLSKQDEDVLRRLAEAGKQGRRHERRGRTVVMQSSRKCRQERPRAACSIPSSTRPNHINRPAHDGSGVRR